MYIDAISKVLQSNNLSLSRETIAFMAVDLGYSLFCFSEMVYFVDSNNYIAHNTGLTIYDFRMEDMYNE